MSELKTISSNGNNKKSKTWKDMHIAIKIIIITTVIIVVGGIGYFVYNLVKTLTKGGQDIIQPIVKTLAAFTTAVEGCLTTSVVNINLKNAGKGYVSSPTITIIGGGGSDKSGDSSLSPTYPATAVALIDKKTGEITSIRLTDTGSGYKNEPKVVLSGGGKGGGAPDTPATATSTISGGPFSSWGCAAFVFAGIAYLIALIATKLRKKNDTEKSLDAESKDGNGSEKITKANEDQNKDDKDKGEETAADKAEKKFKEEYKKKYDKKPSEPDIAKVRKLTENNQLTEMSKATIRKQVDATGKGKDNIDSMIKQLETSTEEANKEITDDIKDTDIKDMMEKSAEGGKEVPKFEPIALLKDSNTCGSDSSLSGCCVSPTPSHCKAWGSAS